MFSHSIYYVSPEEVLDYCVRSHVSMVIYSIHDFVGTSGTFNGEAKWNIQADQVTMEVNGGASYCHPAPDKWSADDCFTKSYNIQGVRITRTLAWTRYRSVGTTHIFKGVVTHRTIPSNTPKIRRFRLTGDDHIDVSLHNGRYTMTYPDGRITNAAADKVDKIAVYALGTGTMNTEARDATINKTRSLDLSPNETGHVASAALMFAADEHIRLRSDISVLGPLYDELEDSYVQDRIRSVDCCGRLRITSDRYGVADDHGVCAGPRDVAYGARNLARGVYRPIMTAARTIGWFAWCCVPGVRAQSVSDQRPRSRSQTTLLVVAALGLLLALCYVIFLLVGPDPATVQRVKNKQNQHIYMRDFSRSNPDSKPGDDYDDTLAVYKTDSRYQGTGVEPDATYSYPETFEFDTPPKKYANRLSRPVTSVRLSANGNTNHNIHVALKTRVASSDRPEPDAAFEDAYIAWIPQGAHDLYGTKLEVPVRPDISLAKRDHERKEWMVRYNQAKQARITAAAKELAGGNKSGLNTKGAFVKAEPSHGKVDEVHGQLSKPRLIISGSDKYNAYVGPRVAKIQRNLVEKINKVKEDEQIIKMGCTDMDKYASHLSLAISRAKKEAKRRNASIPLGADPWKVYVVENDYTNYDSTNNQKKSDAIVRLYPHWGMDTKTQDVIHATVAEKKVVNRDGTKIAWVGTMGSGEPDTWFRNSVGNGLHTKYCLEQNNMVLISMAVSGDDSYAIILSQHPFQEIGSLLADSATRLGYIAKTIVHPVNPGETNPVVGFCSHNLHPKGDGYVMLPSIGRKLARMGLARAHVPGADTVRANIHAEWPRLSRTPLIRALAQALYRHLAPEDKGKGIAEKFTFKVTQPEFPLDDYRPRGLEPWQYDVLSSYNVGIEAVKWWEANIYRFITFQTTDDESRKIVQISNRFLE